MKDERKREREGEMMVPCSCLLLRSRYDTDGVLGAGNPVDNPREQTLHERAPHTVANRV